MASFATTSLSAVGILTYRNQTIGIATTGPLTTAIGISSGALQTWVPPCAYVDNIIVGIVSSINLKKQQIVDICTQASTGDPTACQLAILPSAVTAVYASVTNGTVAVGIGTTTGEKIGLAITSFISYGIVKKDTLTALEYPNLETGNYSTNNPIDNPTNVSVTSSNLGIGKVDTFTQNNGTQLGYVFAITGGGGSCTGWASSITNLINEIATLRSGIATYINDVNTVKGYKHAVQLQYWSYNKVVNSSNDTISANRSLVTVLNNPAYGGPY